MTWTAPTVERTTQIGRLATLPERQMLEGWLTWHRETLLGTCAGLTAAQLVQPVLHPSNLTLLGLVRHMAEVERSWFRRRFAGEDITRLHTDPEDGDEGIEGVREANAERDFARYRAETVACTAAVTGHDLDETCTSAQGAALSLRWLYVHMIQEYARHNGHADLLRQHTDGRTNS
ncbi:DinB family protein [Streptomyces sp. CC224B]|uniref:DinB family protein n=1 Tax=Streptomyces sp. CC224B TaxID=3044571 RepID=UPI0024A8AEE3|nr:DinB family protein [Streptomyces sp. CC224B]